MKKLTFLFAILLVSFASLAQNEKYEAAMKGLVSKINNAPFTESLVPLSNQMERIASAEKNEWLPNYWVAYCNILESIKKTDEDEKDLILDKAEEYIKKADALVKNNDEMEHLHAYYNNARMIVSPMTRWMTYGPKIEEHIKAAKKLNPTNPRVALLEAEGVFYKPEMFGGGKEVAKPMLISAQKMYQEFTPKNEMMPNWGNGFVEYYLSQY